MVEQKESLSSAGNGAPKAVEELQVLEYDELRRLAVLALAVVFAALCFRLGHLPLLAPDEGRNAEVAREMKEAGAWLVPTYDGVDYLDKPALYFKAVALSLAAF